MISYKETSTLPKERILHRIILQMFRFKTTQLSMSLSLSLNDSLELHILAGSINLTV